MRFNTDLLHAGVVREANGATLPPVYQSSAFEQDTAADLEKIFENKAPGYCYTRVGNPTVTAFENRITKLEGGMASIACASGMAAIMNAILNIVRSGDEIVSSASLYGGSIDLFRDIEEFGIKTRYVKNNDWEAIEGAINEHTRLLFAETIGNPCLDVTDVERLAEIAHVQISWSILLPNTSTEAAIRSAVFLLTVEDFNGIPRCILRLQLTKNLARWLILQDSETAFSVTPVHVWHR